MDKKYLFLFNAITDMISELEALRGGLISVQQQAEELYIIETCPHREDKKENFAYSY